MSDVFPTSPTLPTDQQAYVSTPRDFSGSLTLELNDDEIKRAFQVVVAVTRRHKAIWRRKYPFESLDQIADLLEEYEKELAYRMMESVDCLVKVDGTPLIEGKGPIVDWVGKVSGTSLDKYGMDHEKKEWEVKKADARGEDFLGQKDNYKSQ